MLSHGDGLERSLELHRHRVAIVHSEGRLTYGELDAWSESVADLVAECGGGPGAAVGLLLDNEAEFAAAAVAIARLGAAKLPLNPALPADTISYMLELGEADVLIIGADQHELANAALALMNTRPLVIAVRADSLDGARHFPPCPPAASRTRHLAGPVQPDGPAVLQFTGGTTGRPKGAIQSQGGTVAFHTAQMIEGEIREHERMLLSTPVSHAAGAFLESGLLRGATIWLHRGFDVQRSIDTMRTERITWTFLVPTMIYRIIDALPADHAPEDLALTTVVYGAAPISPRRLQSALSSLGAVFVQLYGQTECPVWGTRLGKLDHDPERPHLLSSCGQVSYLARARIVDAEGNEVARGVDGEIALSAPYTMTGYLKDPVATAEKLRDGWVMTGDLGRMDDEGFVYLRDRKSDLIISGGMNVYSKEVEDVLHQHPSVLMAAVVGIPHEEWGEAVHAVVVATDALDPGMLREWCRDKVARYAVPKSVEVVDVLPETPVGKVDKRALRARYWKESGRAIN